MVANIGLIILGMGVLLLGAEGIVRGASSVALKLNVSSLVIGLTIVSFGTSLPEMTVNIMASLRGASDLAVGNIVGSNIANILLVLGVTAFISPIVVKSSTVWRELPVAFLGVALLLLFGNVAIFSSGALSISRPEGFILLAGLAGFMVYVLRLAKRDRAYQETVSDVPAVSLPVYQAVVMIVGSIIGLVIGGNLLVDNAVSIAMAFGLSEALIGITIVGIGTSLPELATSVVAAKRGQTDLAVGNIVGSNIFNVFWIIGLSSAIRPIVFNPTLNVDMFISMIATMLLFVFMVVGKRHYKLERFESLILLGSFVLYVIFLLIRG
ncbi:calcium/sodium antiporter [soil metagenome]